MEDQIKTLYCACCAAMTKGRQYHNQDAGYGLCPDCAKWILNRDIPGLKGINRADYIKETYGIKGYHFAIEGIQA